MSTASTMDAVPKSWPTTLAVLIVAAFHAYALPAINQRIPGTAPEPAGVRVDLGNGVSVVTPEGWLADLTKMRPNETLALTNAASSLVATSFDWTGSEADLIDRTRNLFEATQTHLGTTPVPFRTDHGLAGSTYMIFGSNTDGQVWVAALPGGKVGVAVRVRSIRSHGYNAYRDALRDAVAMVESLQFPESK